MEVHTFRDIEKGLQETRAKFYSVTEPIRGKLSKTVELHFNTSALIGRVVKTGDDEKYALEVLAAAFRRIISSFVLLESGLPQEAHSILRNHLEFILIGIDIIYNDESLKEWKKTVNDDLSKIDPEDWYFTKSRICKRILNDTRAIYPKEEISAAQDIEKEWIRISNQSVHAHSYAQIKHFLDKNGDFQLLGLKAAENYERDFLVYKRLIFNVTVILIGIPKYKKLIAESQELAELSSKVAKMYLKIQGEIQNELNGV